MAMGSEHIEAEEWPEYPTYVKGQWVGGCTFPHLFDPGRCGKAALPGTRGCRKHLTWAKWYQRTIGRVLSLKERITASWR